MTPTDTDRFLAAVRAEALGGLDVAPADVLRLLRIIEDLGREVLRLRTQAPTEAPPGAAPSLGSAEGSTPSLSCHPHCALFKGLPLPPGVLSEVLAERGRQEAKWGQQNHPDATPALLDRPGGCSAQQLAEDLEIPSASRARVNCQSEAERGHTNWASILVEEVSEAVAAIVDDQPSLRAEPIQVAAVCVARVEAIDRRLPSSSPAPPTGSPAAALSSVDAGSEGGSRSEARSPVCPDCRGSGTRRWREGPTGLFDRCLTCAGEGLLGGGR